MKLSKNGKRMGRPPMVKTQPTQRAISIKEAADVLNYLVKDVKGLDILFYSNSLRVEWSEEMFTVDTAELPKVIESIKYLQSKEYVYVP